MEHFTHIRFKNYKAFSDYQVSLKEFNVLVGPNNAGKSTILGGLRILSEGIRKARAKSPVLVEGPNGTTWGYSVPLEDLPVSTENIFHDYNDNEPAIISFEFSNGNSLKLYFPAKGICHLLMNPKKAVRSPSDFKREFPATLSFVPVLGPVAYNERLFQKDTARLALLSQDASRNFRNIWHHFPDGFGEFKKAIKESWPGMDIDKPEIDNSGDKARLHMFCPEERFPREIYWSGFGFQVWCQMLTFILGAKGAALLVIDEPDIYLHADLQRQLVGFLRKTGSDIIIATHSTEIISEVDPDSLLNINKKYRSAKRIKNTQELQSIFQFLGSNLNPILTQLAKTRRAVFVEGKDFTIIGRFARKMGCQEVANRSDFAVIPAEGFNPKKVCDFSAGIEATLGARLMKAVIFDRDYRSDGEIIAVLKQLKQTCVYATIHGCKEIENFLLNPDVLSRAIKTRLTDRKKRGETAKAFDGSVSELLLEITDGIKSRIMSQYLARRRQFEKSVTPGVDETTLMERAMDEFEAQWKDFSKRMKLVPGKEVLGALNTRLQEILGVNLSPSQIVESFAEDEIPAEVGAIIKELESFRLRTTIDAGE